MATFHLFPRLPAELRLRVWELTVEPRTVKVGFKSRYEGELWQTTALYSKTPIPAPLQTCRESRNAGLYQRCFSELCVLNSNRKNAQKKYRRDGYVWEGQYSYVWCNLDIDMIYIDGWLFEDFESIAHLIKRLKFWRNMDEFWRRPAGPGPGPGCDALRWFKNVSEIHVVLDESDDFASWHGTSYEDPWPCDNVLFIDEKEGEEMRMMDLEYKYDREAEVWDRKKWGWKLFYCCGEMLNNVDEEGEDCRASLHHRSLYYYSLS
ncbi:unnamed protein product [Alternaria alternata]